MSKFNSRKVLMITGWISFSIFLLANFLLVLPISINENSYIFFAVFTFIGMFLLAQNIIISFDKIVISPESIAHITLTKKTIINHYDIKKIVMLVGKYPLILIIPNSIDLDILNYYLKDNAKRLKSEKKIIRFDSSKKNIELLKKYGYEIEQTIDLIR